MTFDEDGSFIGQYGTLERKNMQLQKQIMSSNGFHQSSVDSSGHFQSNGNIPSSSNPNNHHLVYSKSAAGGTYV
jgi:hypothetical protein